MFIVEQQQIIWFGARTSLISLFDRLIFPAVGDRGPTSWDMTSNCYLASQIRLHSYKCVNLGWGPNSVIQCEVVSKGTCNVCNLEQAQTQLLIFSLGQ